MSRPDGCLELSNLGLGGGDWGVAPASEDLEILVALASLIRARRYELALTILENEIDDSNSNIDL